MVPGAAFGKTDFKDAENAMKFVRLYCDDEGHSHFEDIEPGFKSVDFAPPAPPLDLSEAFAAKQISFMKASPGWYGDWHPAPARMIHIYISGQVEVTVSGGEVRTFGPGSIGLVEDTKGKGHQSKVIGADEVLIAVILLE
jgi:hypothetical protein